MRVLQVIQELRPGGAERVSIALADHLERRGHAVAMAAAPGPWSDQAPGLTFDLPIVQRRPHRIVAAGAALNRVVSSFRPDIVHAHNPGVGLVAGFVAFRGRRVPGLVSVHGVPDADYPAASRVLRLAGLPVVACGPAVAEALAQAGTSVAATIVNGVSPPPPAADRDAVLTELGLRTDLRLAISVGRLVHQKHHDLAVRAIADVPGAALVVVGAGPLEPELRDLAQALGVSDRVVLAGPRDDARALIAAADVVLIPSRWEGLPMVALEAAAAGTPVVATAVRGLRELFVNDESALLVPADDAPALASAAAAVLHDATLAARLRRGAAAVAAAHSEQAMVDAFERFYGEVRRGRGGGPGGPAGSGRAAGRGRSPASDDSI